MAFLSHASSRRIKSLRIQGGRSGSTRFDNDDTIPLDLEQDPNDLLKEMLVSISSEKVATARKLGHLNNLVKLYCHISDDSQIHIPMDIIMLCLKSTLVSGVKEVRAAGMRALRYLINNSSSKQLLTSLHLDYLVTKCIDISHFNEVERIQAIRLARKMVHLRSNATHIGHEPIVPLSLVACIVSVSLGGAEERDRVYRTCLAVLCEIALIQPWLVVRCNGVLALINAILECHMYQRINECLCFSLMHIIHHPSLRLWHGPKLDVSPLFAPYTELNYRFHPDVDDNNLQEEQEMRFMASRMAIVSLLHTWDGVIHICNSPHMIQSFVQALLIPNPNVRRGILSTICDLFYFNELLWTDDFNAAIKHASPSRFKENWTISEGFVGAEGKSLLPIKSVSRPDLVDCHLAIVLACFLKANLLDTLSSVAISTDRISSVGATVVLGSTMHLASKILPNEGGDSLWHWQLPQLLHNTSSYDKGPPSPTLLEEQLRINLTINRLQEMHLLLKDPPLPYSLYLSQTITDIPQLHNTPSPLHKRSPSFSFSPPTPSRKSRSHSSPVEASPRSLSLMKRNRALNLIRDSAEENTLSLIKNTKVLATKENTEWDWTGLLSLLTSPPSISFLRGLNNDDTLRRFFRRLIYFYLPSSKLFSALELCKDGQTDENRKFVFSGCAVVQFLSQSDEEGLRLLNNLVVDIIQSLPKVNSEALSYSKAVGSLGITCSRDYFLMLGALSCSPKGDQILRQCKAYHYLMGLASEGTHENLVKLLVSSLHYSEDSPSKTVLSKVLTTCNETGRLYATTFLRVLLRTECPGFVRWGTELLTTQLFDKSNDVASEALDILHEACDNRDYLQAVIRLRPTLLHLGERGVMLVCRFLSEPQGFEYLSNNHYLARELDRWWTSYNERYVLHVEELLKLSLTSFERINKDEGFARRSGNRKGRQAVYVPAHLYGELCRHADGMKIIESEGIVSKLTQELVSLSKVQVKLFHAKSSPSAKQGLKANDFDLGSLLKLKSCVWALCHIGSTVHGLPLLTAHDSVSIISRLSTTSPCNAVRGTCVYGLNIIAQTILGVEVLKGLRWKSVLTTVSNREQITEDKSTLEPIVTPRTTRGTRLSKSASQCSHWSATSGTSQSNSARSPSGSIRNRSASSSVKSRSSRSRSSSKIISSPGSDFNRKNEAVVEESPFSGTDASTASTQSSVFELELDGYASQHTLTTHSLSAPSEFDPMTSPNNIDHDEDKSNRRAKKTLLNLGTKVKMRSKLIDFFSKKSRSKSLTPESLLNFKTESSSSGYVSDQIPNSRFYPLIDQSASSTLTNQRPASMMTSSSVSVDTLKSSENAAALPNNLPAEQKVSLHNANNSGQSGSIPGKSPTSPKRCHSMPNMLEEGRTRSELPVDKNVRADENSLCPSPRQRLSLELKSVNCVTPLTVLPPSPNSRESPSPRIPLHVTPTDSPPNVDDPINEPNPNLLSPGDGYRIRGSTQVSQDSGVGDDVIAPIVMSCTRESCSLKNDEAEMLTSENATKSDWEYKQPSGILAVRRLNNRRDSKGLNVMDIQFVAKRFSVEEPALEKEYINEADKNEIILNTRYVGITIPSSLPSLFEPINTPNGCIDRSLTTTIIKLNDADCFNNVNLEDGESEDESAPKRKISSAIQPGKFRGLDQQEGYPPDMGTRTKRGNPTMTPVAHTPDSLLSEASDLCSISGNVAEAGSDEYASLIHDEIIQLVVNLGSSVGIKAHETALLMMKEKRPELFDSLTLYENIIEIMSEYSYRLTTRRFVQELFQDVKFTEVYKEAHKALQSIR